MIVVLVGESASGKSTIAKLLVERCKEFSRIVTYTTRPMRKNEKANIDYHFVSDREFDEMKEQGVFIEYAKYRDWQYGTAANFSSTDNNVLILTPAGARAIRKKLSNDPSLHQALRVVYLDVDRKSRLIKLLQRGDNIDEAYRRSLSDLGQFDAFEQEADFTIHNHYYTVSASAICDTLIDYINSEREKIDV